MVCNSVADRDQKAEKDQELKTMVLSKMQKPEEQTEDRMLIDSVKYYVERRKNEIESILERQDFLLELKTNLQIEHKYLSVRDTYMKVKDRIVEGLVR